MDQSNNLAKNSKGQSSRLFEENESAKEISSVPIKVTESLFDEEFESKVSVWKSYKEDKNEQTKEFDEALLNNPVLSTVIANENTKTEQNIDLFVNNSLQDIKNTIHDIKSDKIDIKNTIHDVVPNIMDINTNLSTNRKINKFWEPKSIENIIDDSTNDNDIKAIEPKILSKLIFENTSTIRKNSHEGTVHPALVDEPISDSYENKRLKTNTIIKGQSSEQSNTNSAKVSDTNSLNTAQSNTIKNQNNLTENTQTTTKSFNMSQEIIQNLENKIKILTIQIENFKQALASKDNVIKDLRLQLELHSKNTQNIDFEYIQNYGKQGLEILNKLENYEIPSDSSNEIKSLKIEILNLKNIIDELSIRLRQGKE